MSINKIRKKSQTTSNMEFSRGFMRGKEPFCFAPTRCLQLFFRLLYVRGGTRRMSLIFSDAQDENISSNVLSVSAKEN